MAESLTVSSSIGPQSSMEINNEMTADSKSTRNHKNNNALAISSTLLISIAFSVLFLAKLSGQYLDEIFVLLGIAISAEYNNFQMRKLRKTCLKRFTNFALSSFGICNVVFMHIIFRHKKIYMGFICFPNNISSADWCLLLWSILIVDYSLKHIGIFIKSLFMIVPDKFMELYTRGIILEKIEHFLQLYRTIPPIISWIRYLAEIGLVIKNSYTVSIILFIAAYTTIKIISLFLKVSSSWNAYRYLNSIPPYRLIRERDRNDGKCILCLEDRDETTAVSSCGHAFCKGCIDHWLTYFSTCPSCQTSLSSEKKEWRDGNTTSAVQLF